MPWMDSIKKAFLQKKKEKGRTAWPTYRSTGARTGKLIEWQVDPNDPAYEINVLTGDRRKRKKKVQ